MKGPKVGPREGAREKNAIAIARSSGLKTSEMTPPALVNGDEPNVPQKNRRTRSVAIPWSAVHAALKTTYMP